MSLGYFLASTEDRRLRLPRKCAFLGRAETTEGRGLLLARVDPPLPAVDIGRNDDTADVVLMARHQGVSLFPITRWPAYVHLLLPKGESAKAGSRIAVADLVLVTWAEIYPTEQEAASAMLHTYGKPQ